MFYNDFENPENNSIIDIVKYKEICKVCDEILLSPEANEITVAIPILHVIREHPVFLKQYENLFAKNFNKLNFKFSTKILKSFLYSLLQTISPKKYWYTNKKLLKFYDYIFVSHLLNEEQLDINDDFYFGNIPSYLQKKGKKVLLVLFNHTAIKESKFRDKWPGENDVQRLILSKNTGILNEIKYYYKVYQEKIRLLKISKKENNILKKSIINLATSETRPIINNLQFSKQFYELFKNSRTNNVIITHEGHAWEKIIFSNSRINNPYIKCIAYQHALIFKEQHSIRRKLQQIYNPDIILTSGIIGKIQLEKTIKDIPIKVFGSNRISNSQFEKFNKSDSKTILVIPEAINSECIILFQFSLICAKFFPDYDFIWRLHPLMTFNQLNSENFNMNSLPKNIIISQKSLEQDIKISKFALYRGTTTIINCILNGIIPIYIQKNDELSIDPIYEINNNILSYSNPIMLKYYFNKQFDTNDIYYKKIYDYANNLFTKIDLELL
jgi:hypothetical protein